MKTYLRYFLISIILHFAATEAIACWESWYTPGGYYMYRVYNNTSGSEHDDITEKNCIEWQKMTSETISIKDIYHVVYEMSLEEFEAVYNNKNIFHENKFIEWITKNDSELLDFLLLAKTNEYIRMKCNSRWYYPTMRTGTRMTLEDVAAKAQAHENARLRDRYLLQAVRALFSLAKYEECIKLWDNEISFLPNDNLMRQLIHPYIAGAEFRVNHTEKAIEYFAQLGDIKSVLLCLGRTGKQVSLIDALELICEYAPNSIHIEETLQTYVRKLEPSGDYYSQGEFVKTHEYEKLYTLCLKMAHGSESDKPAMWYYTAAFLADLSGDTSIANNLLGLAEKCKATAYIDESIKVFRIYLDAKLLPYDYLYEDRLFVQLKWLDAKIKDNIDEDVSRETASGTMLSSGRSYYYWNDMMRRILLSEVCPRMIQAGKIPRALQLANMAENRLLNLVDKKDLYGWVNGDYKIMTTCSMTDYRYSDNFNSHDYRNCFFEMIDSIGLDNAIKYVRRVSRPQNEFDIFLNNRGYVGSDYLNDILGTQCLRNMQYDQAMHYLANVSEAYKNHHNLYIQYDPFTLGRKTIRRQSDFKYDFAREMRSLEQAIDLVVDPNRKARLMLKYAIGIKNSFDLCWEITQYYRGTRYWGQVCEKRDWQNDKYTTAAMRRVKGLLNTVCDIATDPETGADIQYILCNFKTVAENYPDTRKGRLVRAQCDNLFDYNAGTSGS